MPHKYISKPHYEVLDGLRGVAAMLVVAFHLFETYATNHFTQIINHGYLAVDFFFVLSGFVIGYAYDDRWDKMTIKDFLLRRVVRLHPMLVAGTLIGGLLFYFSAGDAFPSVAQTEWWKLLLLVLFCCTILPIPTGWDCRGWAETNPFSGPAWSLQFEYIANLVYAFFYRRCRLWVLVVSVLAFAVLTVLLTMNIDLFGLLALRSEQAYTVIGGWSITSDQIYVGASRLLYPFFAGLLLYRLGIIIRTRHGYIWASLLIAALLMMPYVGTETTQWTNGLYECLCILILFPLIVSMGAGSNISGKASKVCTFIGNLSYPLYITHYPLIYIHVAWAHEYSDLPLATHIAVSVAVFIISIANAYACMKLWDAPVRKWLTNRLMK